MFCYIKYAGKTCICSNIPQSHISVIEQEDIKKDSTSTSLANSSLGQGLGGMHRTNSKLNLRENKTLLVNPNCYTKILIDYVMDEINFDKDSGTNNLYLIMS